MVNTQVFVMVLLVAVVLIVGLHANPMDVDTDSDSNERVARGGPDLGCTVECAKWWRCRLGSFFLKRCNRPDGCECDRFFWEG